MPTVTFIPPPLAFRDPGRDVMVPILQNAYQFADTLLTQVPQLQMQQQKLDLDHQRMLMDATMQQSRNQLDWARLRADQDWRDKQYNLDVWAKQWQHHLAQTEANERARAAFYKEYQPFFDPTNSIFQNYTALQKAYGTGEKAWREALEAARRARENAAVAVTRAIDGDTDMTRTVIRTFVPESPAGKALLQQANVALQRIQSGTGTAQDYALVHELRPYLSNAPAFTVDTALLARFGGMTDEQLQQLAQLDRTRLESFLADARTSQYLTPDQIAAWRRLLEFQPLRLQMQPPAPPAAPPVSTAPSAPAAAAPPQPVPAASKLPEQTGVDPGQAARAAAVAATARPDVAAIAIRTPARADPAEGQNALQEVVASAIQAQIDNIDKQVSQVIDELLLPRSWWRGTNSEAIQRAQALSHHLRALAKDTGLPQSLRTLAAERANWIWDAISAHQTNPQNPIPIFYGTARWETNKRMRELRKQQPQQQQQQQPPQQPQRQTIPNNALFGAVPILPP